MLDKPKRLSKAQVAEARQRRLEAMAMQAIEGNPLSAEDIAMFEMFEREGWASAARRTSLPEPRPLPPSERFRAIAE